MVGVMEDEDTESATEPAIQPGRHLAENRDDVIVVLLPEYVARHRWERLLFNENGRRIRDELLGHPNIFVAQVPFRRDL